jgi:hypothetical protein
MDNKVTVAVQKPSETIVADANAVTILVVGSMRIGVKKPGVLAQYRIVEVVGASAKNEVYMGMIAPLLWVCEIDGQPQVLPSTKRELEALIQRLGEEGLSALMKHIMPRNEDDDEGEKPEVSGEALKN